MRYFVGWQHMRCYGVGGAWMFGTHLQGPHQSVCWLRPKRARHFLGEPGSVHNARHAQNKQEEKQKQWGAEEEEEGLERQRREINKGRKRHRVRCQSRKKHKRGCSFRESHQVKTVSSNLQHSKTSTTVRITSQHAHTHKCTHARTHLVKKTSQTSWNQAVKRDSERAAGLWNSVSRGFLKGFKLL